MNLIKLIIFACLLAGCSPVKHPIEAGEITGEYLASYHEAEDKLILFENGTYEHAYNLNGKLLTNRDRWEFLDSTSDNTQLDLRLFNFKFRAAKDTMSTTSDWIVSAEKTERISLLKGEDDSLRIRLCFNYDLDHCFVKQRE